MKLTKEYLEKLRSKQVEQAPATTLQPTTLSKLELLKAKLAAATVAGSSKQLIPAPATLPAAIKAELLPVATSGVVHTGMDGKIISYNAEQEQFIRTAASGKHCVLIGAAGTGKTTGTQGAVRELIMSGKCPPMTVDGHKHLVEGSPGVIIISYTRRAVNNIRKVQSDDMKGNCITAHKLLEYAPVYYDVEQEDGTTRTTMRFEATRNEQHPLPAGLRTIIVEEASMLDVELFMKIVAALPHPVQWILIGDINQLPPIFGAAILGYAMVDLQVIELVTVYRQALESPIIRLAHHILQGKRIFAPKLEDWSTPDQLKLHPWKKPLNEDVAVRTLGAFFSAAYDAGRYNPDEDMILLPFNKGCGTVELNKHIANHIARSKGAVTYEIMAGFNKHYYSVGDRVMYDREDATIVEIRRNVAYTGAPVQPEGTQLDYWGHNPNLKEDSLNAGDTDIDIDLLLEQVVTAEDRVTQSSHKIVVRLLDSGDDIELDKASEVNALLPAYAMTVHKAQGSEWRSVYLCFHKSHATMLQRELLYTAVTRAKESLYVICEQDTFVKGVQSQKIKGDTLKEKALFFQGKKLEGGFHYKWNAT